MKSATTSKPVVRGERERPMKSCLALERVRVCEESNYKQTSSEGREREANEVLFRSGEGERVRRGQLQALRLQCVYIY